MRAKKTQQSTVSSAFHEDIVKQFTNQVEQLRGQISQRDKLIGLMCKGHTRDVQVSDLHRQNVISMNTLFESFLTTYNTFKRAVLNDSIQGIAFDDLHQKSANEIQTLLVKIENETRGHGAIASQMAQTEAKAITRDHTLTN